jgi:hypothetical protein
VTIWDSKTGTERLRLSVPGPHVAWSPDGRWLATADVRPVEKGHHVLVWDIDRLLNR